MRASNVVKRVGGVVNKKVQSRAFASQPSLDMELPGMPELAPASAQEKPAVQVTTLDNGLRVASQETFGQITGKFFVLFLFVVCCLLHFVFLFDGLHFT